MSRKRKDYPVIEGLEITDFAAEGNALGRHGEVVVFVPMAVPGDVVDVQVRRKRRRFMEGVAISTVRRSPIRVEPFCSHFGVCGGCKWQNIPYHEQLKVKQRQVEDQLRRIGRLELPPVEPILGSEKTTFYRNKLEFTFAHRRWMTAQEIASGAELEPGPALGFHIPGMFDKVLDVGKCWLQPDPSNAVRTAVRDFCLDRGYEFYNAREHSGLMRNMVVRTASTGQTMVIVVFARPDRERIAALMDHLKSQFPDIASLMYVVNTKMNDSLGDQEHIPWSGADHIVERMEGLNFRVGPKSFYQTNSAQAYNLYKTVREFARLTGGETVYDLYTGTGTIANFVAGSCARVVGVEYVPEAIEDAKENSRRNAIGNTSFFAGDMKKVLDDGFVQRHGRPDVVIVDPPRAGMDEEVVRTIMRARPQRVVYVSCNPATQARDLALMDGLYRVERVRPVDMFPHTHHVENVVALTLKDNL